MKRIGDSFKLLSSLSLATIVSLAVTAQTRPAPPTTPGASTGYTPHRVYDSRHKRYTDFEMMLLDLAKPDGGWGLAYHVPRLMAQPLLIWAALWAGGVTRWPFRPAPLTGQVRPPPNS